jgi:hypothetical protein
MNLCPDCFGVRGLQRRISEIRRDHDVGRCDFHPSKKGVPLEAVGELVDTAFRDNFVGGIDDPYSGEPSGDSLDDIVMSLTEAEDQQVAEALKDWLVENDDYWPPDGEEPFYSDEYGYRRDRYRLGEPARRWREFRRSLVHGQRFFNTVARDLVADIFQDVHQQRDAKKQGPVYMIAPGEAQARFFRARVADDEGEREAIEKNLVEKLGPPPERKRRAGRLNPAGVIGFYGAFDLDTCVAELRPSVGSIVIAAEFEITEAICVLDMTRFDAKPKAEDPYARNARDRMAQWNFMRTFMGEIARPVSKGDEHLDYLPTQAVAEYLNQHHRFKFAGQERTIDAVVYSSAQHPGGKNIAILGKAAAVGQPPGAEGDQPEKPQDLWPSLAFMEEDPPQARIVPRPQSVVKLTVSGATFTTKRFYDFSDLPEGDDLDDLPVDDEL